MLGLTMLLAGCGVQQSEPGAAGPRSSAQAAPLAAQPPQLLAVRRSAPDAAFVDAHGKPVKLDQFAGRAVVLNLWATWCAPCVREMPSLDELARRAPSIAVVPVSMDVQGPKPAIAFLERKGLAHLQAYHDPDGQLMRRFGVHGLPASVLIDQHGRVAAVIRGEVDWMSPAIRELLARV